MSKCKSHARVFMIGALTLCLCACQTFGSKYGAVKPGQPGSQAVVLMDPKIDDAMLPAIGEGLSKGQVTIYRLDGPAPSTGVVAHADDFGAVMPPVTAQSRVMLTAPMGNRSSTNDDGSVTVYSLETGEAAVPMRPPVLMAPKISPPVAKKPLPSPFKKDAAKPKKKVKAASVKKRPPQGMTY
jgi:hypothetical protein